MEYDNKTVVSSKEENLVQNILYSTLRRAHFLDTVLISRTKHSADMSKTITNELTKKYGAQGGPIKEYCINGFPGSYAREASDAVLQQNIKQFVDVQLPYQKKQQQQHTNTKGYESMDQFGTMLNSTLHQLTTLTMDSYAPPKSLDFQYVATPPMCSKCGSVAFTMVEVLSMSPDEVNAINVSSPNLPKPELMCLQCLWTTIQ